MVLVGAFESQIEWETKLYWFWGKAIGDYSQHALIL
jgi:hypothetical protein